VGAYASAAEVTSELAAHDDLHLPAGAALDALIEAAQRAVDRRLGPLLVDATTGLKLTPVLLTVAQRGALVRATAVAVGHAVLAEGEETFGTLDLLPAGLTPLRGPSLGALIDAQLAGFDLLQRSGCALPDPEPLPVVGP
jgi:hypothetical protein